MTSIKKSISAVLCVSSLVLAPHLSAQSAPPTQITPSNDTGTNPFGSYSTDAGNVNLSNGNLSLAIPLLTLPGRNGLDYSLAIEYDSKIWTPSASYVGGSDIMYQWKSEQRRTAVGALGWRLGTPSVDPGRADVDQFGNNLGLDGSTLTLADGSKHYLSGRSSTMDAQDGSGITAFNDANHNLITAKLKDGTTVFGANGQTYEDTNGNFISSATDTVGRQVTTTMTNYNMPGGGIFPSSISYKDSNGVAQTVTFSYTSIPLFQTSGQYQTPQPPFAYPMPTNCQGICHTHIWVTQPTAGDRLLLTGVTLPDNTQYTFTYNVSVS